MDELTMLVHMAGADLDTVGRLREAGFRGLQEILRAGPEDLARAGGLAEPVARRLIRAARRILEPAHEHRIGSRRSVLHATTSGRAASRGPEDAPAQVRGATALPALPPDQGVSKAESSALAGDLPAQNRVSRSFWRFG
jgi:hypothetical protein